MEQFKLVADESVFLALTPEEITIYFFILGLAVAETLTIDELNVLANGLFEWAQVLFVIASQRTLLNDVIQAQEEAAKAKEEKTADENVAAALKRLQEQCQHLQAQIDKLNRYILKC